MSITQAPEESFDFDIIRGLQNGSKQTLNFGTDGMGMFVEISENGKSARFDITYENRMILQNIRTLLGEIDSHSTKKNNNLKRV
jgi:hypothetical protein